MGSVSIQVGEVSVRALLHTDLGREGGRVGWDQTPDPHPEVPSPVHQGKKKKLREELSLWEEKDLVMGIRDREGHREGTSYLGGGTLEFQQD